MISKPYEPLSVLFLFPVFSTRKEYEERTGKTCPPFDPSRPPKYWEDLSVPDNKRVVLYERTLAVDEYNNPLTDDHGKPFFEPMVLPRQHAMTVNIPPKEAANEHKYTYEVAVPCRALEGDEELAFQPGVPFRIPVVFRPSLTNVDEPMTWTRGDRELLRKIAAKLGV